jgi:cell division protein FtsI/penicillin-binding protein 2
MTQRLHTWRLDLLFAVLALALVALAGRMALLIRSDKDKATEMALRQQRTVTPLPARPGNIYARARNRFVLLAGSKQIPSCYADPSMIQDDEIPELAIKVGNILDMDPVAVQEAIVSKRTSEFVWVKRGINEKQAEKLAKMNRAGFGVLYEWRREYPNGNLASTVLGFSLADGTGGGGLELSQHKELAAVDGRKVALADAARRPFWPMPEQSIPPQDGKHVFLTIDAVIQGYLEDAVRKSVEKFGAKWGVGIVLNPKTGDILAMCSIPDYDPNEYGKARPEDRANHAVNSPYEPGSAAKSVFAAAAVDANVATYETQIFCENGSYEAARGGRITDHGASYGTMSLADVVVHSSNIGMAKVGEKLGNGLLFEVARRFGFSADTQIGLPGESPGILRPLARWDGYSLRRVPFGQEISVTAIQLAMAFGSFANGGVLMQPRLVDRVTDADGKVVWKSEPRTIRRTLNPGVAEQSVAVMKEVVERGTGTNAKLTKWTSWGKTGTAQIGGPGGYIDRAFTGSFVGGAPAGETKVVCLISIYWPEYSKGHYGGTVAAPYFKEVMEQTLSYLNVPPDKSPDDDKKSEPPARAGW